MMVQFNCPRCSEPNHFIDEAAQAGAREVTCDVCAATLAVTYTSTGDIEGISVEATEPGRQECPVCMETLTFDIATKDGEVDLKCPACGETIGVYWSDWGFYVHLDFFTHEGLIIENDDIDEPRDVVNQTP